MDNRIQIHLNGERREVRAGASLHELLEELSLSRDRVAVERNRVLVRRAEMEGCVLEANDELEVVTLVGGG